MQQHCNAGLLTRVKVLHVSASTVYESLSDLILISNSLADQSQMTLVLGAELKQLADQSRMTLVLGAFPCFPSVKNVEFVPMVAFRF